MICGIEWYVSITKEKADLISKKFDVRICTYFTSKCEATFNNRRNSFLRKKTYNNLFIEIRKIESRYTLLVRGSLHKFFHGNNRDTFTGNQILTALQGLSDLFEIELSDAIIKNIEVGLNLSLSFLEADSIKIYNYLDKNLLHHKKKHKQEMKGKIGFVFPHDDYSIKLYSKDQFVLRYEIKYTSITKLKKFGLNTLADINVNSVNLMMESLKYEWGQIIMRDGLNIYNNKNRNDALSSKEIDMLNKFSSEHFYQSYKDELLKANKKGKEQLRQENYRFNKRCLMLIKKYGNEDHQKIAVHINQLINWYRCTWENESFSTKFVTNSSFDKIKENVTRTILTDRKQEVKSIVPTVKPVKSIIHTKIGIEQVINETQSAIRNIMRRASLSKRDQNVTKI